MTVKQLIDFLIGCPSDQEVKVNFNGMDYDVKDCDHTSIETTITVSE